MTRARPARSEKASPVLTLPRHTAKKTAPLEEGKVPSAFSCSHQLQLRIGCSAAQSSPREKICHCSRKESLQIRPSDDYRAPSARCADDASERERSFCILL